MHPTKLNKAFTYWRDNPVEAIKDWFKVTPEDYQGDIIDAVFNPINRGKVTRVSVKSGHGVGKTSTQAWMGWFFLYTRLMSKVIATAPTSHQLTDVLWPEFNKWYYKVPDEMKFWDISATHIRHKEHDKNWFAAARTSNKQDNMQGFHEDHIMVLVEEASGVPPMIFDPIEGILSNAEEDGQEAILALFGNPTQTAGEFFNSFHRNKDLYQRYTISGDTVLPVDKFGGQIYISSRVSNKFRSVMAQKYGKDSPVYDVRVRGLFPREADDVVIPMGWAENAQNVILPNFDDVADPITLVMDVARFGGDETTLGIYRKGHCLEMKSWAKTSTNKCVDILKDAFFHSKYSTYVARVTVDEPGVGGGVVDVARREGIPITPYNGGASMKTGMDPEDDCRMFFNRRSRDWWHVRRLFEQERRHIPRDILVNDKMSRNDEDLVNQLSSVKYDYVNEKIKVESKKEMRERLGEFASPDRGDNIIMGMAPYVTLNNTVALENLDLKENVHYGDDRATAQAELELW